MEGDILKEDSRVALDPNEFSAVVKARGGKVYPDLVNSLALRNLPKDTAAAEGWPTYYMPEPCANGHTAARFVKNSLCVDCWRVRQGRDTIYPTAKNRTYYKQRDPAAVAANGAPVTVAPSASLPPEPKPVEQRFLAELDNLRDFDAAAAAVNWTRGLVESRASSNPVFAAALTDLCTRRDIPRTRAVDPTAFPWNSEKEKQFAARLVDCGLLEQVRQEMAVTASEYHDRLQRSPAFAALIDAATPIARVTLKDRALASAEKGNDRLLKIFEKDIEENSYANMSVEEMNSEIIRLLKGFDKKGILIPSSRYIHRITKEEISLLDYYPVDDGQTQRGVDNSDLVGAT
jgi:hypothetical protein